MVKRTRILHRPDNPYMAVGTSNPRVIQAVELGLKALLLLNLLDAACTLVWCLSGLAQEANPLMRHLLSWGPVPFIEGKVALVLFGVWVLSRAKHHVLAEIGVASAVLAYVCVAGVHVAEIVRLAAL
jgi:hypothetical protein